ncbi:hypothetical protein [Methylotenera sp.]|uniref:hypothetical protein n=1 Tax=Methylotenera sp. TaxID=2051956 RepID=UPI002EDB2719
MAKNYFSAEQFKDIANKADLPFEHLTDYYLQKLKDAMNLAVETAIGDVVAYEYHIPTEFDGWSRVELSRNELDVTKDTIITNLYSVKELDN